ncbi:MAG: efflux RND transporter periplasmic adaptor subunit [Thermoanaerobaculia bacterium]
MRRRSLGVAALALVAGGVATWLGVQTVAAAGDGAWGTVERRDLVLGVPVEGELEARNGAFLGPPTIPQHFNFRIAFMAPEGQEVRRGQPVLAFDTTELENRLQQRIADRDSAETEIEKRRTDLAKRESELAFSLAEARADLRKTELQLETPEDLMASNELATQRIDRGLARREIAYLEERLALLERQAEAELGTLGERRARAAARVREIEDHLERMRVPAPRDGVVIYYSDRRGEKSKVGDTVWRGRPVLQVPDLDRLQASGSVEEAEAGTLAPGQPVTLRLDAHPDRPVDGRVAAIGRTVQRRSPRDPVKVVHLEIELDAVDPAIMRPGMRFRGRVETERIGDAVLVPAEAVLATPGGPVVYRRARFGHEVVRPELGRRNAEAVQVLDGLRPGERVSLGVPDGVEEITP